MAKRPYRTPKQQEYRDNLAHDTKNLRNRYGNTWKELAKTLLDDQKYHPHNKNKYINSLWDGRKLNKEDALKMIENNPQLVSGHLNHFKWLDDEVAQKLIAAWEVTFVSNNLGSFEWLDEDTANEILDWIHTDKLPYFLYKINSFNTLDKNFLLKFLKKIPDRKHFYSDSHFSNYCNEIYDLIKNNIDKFEWVSLDRDLAAKMIEAGLAQQVTENIKDFEWIDLNDVLGDRGTDRVNSIEELNMREWEREKFWKMKNKLKNLVKTMNVIEKYVWKANRLWIDVEKNFTFNKIYITWWFDNGPWQVNFSDLLLDFRDYSAKLQNEVKDENRNQEAAEFYQKTWLGNLAWEWDKFDLIKEKLEELIKTMNDIEEYVEKANKLWIGVKKDFTFDDIYSAWFKGSWQVDFDDMRRKFEGYRNKLKLEVWKKEKNK